MRIIQLLKKLIKKVILLTSNSKNIIASPEKPYVDYDNCLVQSNGDIFGSSVFLIKDGCRHYVPDLDWLVQHGFTFPSDIKYVTDKVILNYRPSSPAPHKWSLKKWFDPPTDISMMNMRELASSRLNGSGIECGAGTSPFPVPLNCDIKYIDRFSKSDLQKQLYPGQQIHNLIEPDILTDLNSLDGIEDSSLDFIIACHVIEHLKNPIGALESSYKKLCIGGSIVLVVPDKNKTFDKDRRLTSLEHLILDYQKPSKYRDKEDYTDFYKSTYKSWAEKEIDLVIEKAFIEEVDIHYHTFTYESFIELVNYIHNNICPWSSIWSQPTLSNSEEAIEFYFVLTK